MDTRKLITLVDQLEDNLDDLEETLQPILTSSLSDTTKKLPLLDRAKLHMTIAYAVESLIHAYLRLNGENAKEHKIQKEIDRLKQYHVKIKNAEAGTTVGTTAGQAGRLSPRSHLMLDKQAVARIIKHSLAGNNKIDLAQAEAEAKQRLLAKRKLKTLEQSMKEKAADNDTNEDDVHISESEVASLVAAAVEVANNDSQPSNSTNGSMTPTQNGNEATPTVQAKRKDPKNSPSKDNSTSETASKLKKEKKKDKKRKQEGDERDEEAKNKQPKLSKGEKKAIKREKMHEKKVALREVAAAEQTTSDNAKDEMSTD